MTDDIIDTAGTLVAGAEALKEAGATKVYACATHGLFNGPALERIAAERDRQARRHRHRAGRPAHEAGQHRGALDLAASWPRRSRTCSRTTPSRRSSPARTSSSDGESASSADERLGLRCEARASPLRDGQQTMAHRSGPDVISGDREAVSPDRRLPPGDGCAEVLPRLARLLVVPVGTNAIGRWRTWLDIVLGRGSAS